MQRRGLIIFIVLNVLISLGVAFGVISLWNAQNPSAGAPVQVITVEVRLTNPPAPTFTPWIITATPSGSIGALPTGVLDASPAGPTTPLPTVDATLISGALGSSTTLQGTATALPENCILHVIASGDTPFGVASQYGADFFAVMEVNGLTDETATALQIGDVLIVPLEGCPLTAADVAAAAGGEATEEATAEATPEATAEGTVEALPTARPTLTLPPTAANAQVEIVEVIGAGDVTSEGVVIRNQGNTINVNGWTLSDDAGTTYTFAERVLFSNAQITLFSRVGQDTAIALFWNRSAPLFKPGAVLTLRDRNGAVQSTFRVPAPQSLP